MLLVSCNPSILTYLSFHQTLLYLSPSFDIPLLCHNYVIEKVPEFSKILFYFLLEIQFSSYSGYSILHLLQKYFLKIYHEREGLGTPAIRPTPAHVSMDPYLSLTSWSVTPPEIPRMYPETVFFNPASLAGSQEKKFQDSVYKLSDVLIFVLILSLHIFFFYISIGIQ